MAILVATLFAMWPCARYQRARYGGGGRIHDSRRALEAQPDGLTIPHARALSPERFLAIPARLKRKQMRLPPIQLHELFIRPASSDDAPAIEHRDLIGHSHRREPMRDQNSDAFLREWPKSARKHPLPPAPSIAAVGHRAQECPARVRMKARDSAIFCH